MWIGIIGIILLIVGCCAHRKSWVIKKGINDGIFAFNWLAAVFGTISLIVAVITYTTSYTTLASMNAFHDKTQSVYAQMAEQNKQAVTVKTISGSAIYKTIPALHLKKIEWFNNSYYYYELWQDHWFIGDYIGRMSAHLKPITEYKYQP